MDDEQKVKCKTCDRVCHQEIINDLGQCIVCDQWGVQGVNDGQ